MQSFTSLENCFTDLSIILSRFEYFFTNFGVKSAKSPNRSSITKIWPLQNKVIALHWIIIYFINYFFKSINFTGGLPILRVSPDHGPAFDISNKFIAKNYSLIAALKLVETYS